jgi:DUF1680 family protein
MIESNTPSAAAVSGPASTPAPASAGPVRPAPAAIGALRPLGLRDVRLDPDGLLGAWQERNAAATLPHCVDRLHDGGAVDNVRRVVGETDRPFAGMWFADSDIYKTLEAAAWEAARRPGGDSPELRRFLDETTALLAGAQDDDGYLNSYHQVDHRDRQWRELRRSHELYCAGHLIQAAVAAARAGAAEGLLPMARRFADLLVDRFGPGGTDAVCGHPEIETALVELYRETGHEPYLGLARRFVDLRGHGLLGEDSLGPRYYQDHAPVRTADEVTGHAVRQLYLLAGVVDVAVETGDHELLRAAERLWESAYRTKTYLTGAHGSRHRDEAYGDPYELPPDRAYAETCAAIASFQWNWRMLLATGGHRYADEMERVLYNAIAGSTALDGTSFFYSNPLQLRTGHDGSNEDAPSRRLPWYSCFCCPPNLARLMASLQSYVASTDADGLQLHLYGAGTVHGEFGTVEVDTRYPWDGRITLRVRSRSDRPWTLALRVPGWCTALSVTVDGAPVDPEARDGYLRLTRQWADATTIVLDLSMSARLVSAHPRVDAVRGCVALVRGPLVYCLEQVDLPNGVTLEDVRLDTSAPVLVAGPVERPATGRSGAPPGASADGAAADGASADGARPSAIPGTLTARGLVDRPASAALYPDLPTAAGQAARTPPPPAAAVPLVAVPYFLWGNRATGAMRVWIPAATPDEPPPVA